MIRVLVADDQPLMRTAYDMTLRGEEDMELVGEAANGQEAIDQARRLHPDVILMDVRMPVLDGVEATRVVSTDDPAARILILTTFDIDEYVVEALRAGASGFLLKDVRPDELVQAIRIVARGDALLAPSVTRRLLEAVGPALEPLRPKRAAALSTLTESELKVLALVGRGLSNDEVAAELFVAETTVRTHLRHILDKLGLRNRVQAVVFAYDTGLVQPNAHA
jgi:DNA-binding NarL/FixJ family response regulator